MAQRRQIPLAPLIVAAAFGITAPVYAQPPAAPPAVQPPAAPPAPEPPPRLEATGQFTFLGTSGNTSTHSLGTGGDVILRTDPWTYNGKVLFAEADRDEDLIARSFVGRFRASRKIDDRLSAYGQYDFLHDTFAGVDQRHIEEGGISYQAVDWAPHRLRVDAGLGYLYEARPDGHFDSAMLSLGAAYRLAISTTGELTYEPRFLLTLVDLGATRYDQVAALSVALNTILSLKLTHTIRYSAAPAPGFKSTDTIAGVSLVAKVRRP